jgi:SAM-dependent methyltransferase
MSDVGAVVQGFYERHPYPRPVDSLDAYRTLWSDPQRRRADHCLFEPAKPSGAASRILVAGCGTSQAAKYALRFPDAQVTGIDFSANSVRCTEELKQRYQLRNLDVQQLSLERAHELGGGFDRIICTGVLHHLADPDAGLRALRHVLAPDGAMHLMLYAPYGRTGIYMLQEFCRRVGVAATDEGIGDLVTALKSLPPGHPLEHVLRQAPDFHHPAGLADALLHPQDRAYSVPELFAFLERGGLVFGRWLAQAPYSAHCGTLAKIPQSASMTQLTPAEQFAAAELFRGTMLTHSAVVYRDDRPGGSPQAGFTRGDDWMQWVPVRLPDAVIVREKLPAGVAAVLINRSHTCTDLFLPIDAAQLAIVDAMDGRRQVREIVPEGTDRDAVCELLLQLWRYDQVVFDASGVAIA